MNANKKSIRYFQCKITTWSNYTKSDKIFQNIFDDIVLNYQKTLKSNEWWTWNKVKYISEVLGYESEI